MKRILLLIAFMNYFFVEYANAQKFTFEVEGGVNTTHFIQNTRYSIKSGGMGLGYQLSTLLNYHFSDKWWLSSGVSFVHTVTNMDLSGNTDHLKIWDVDIKLNHHMFPLKVGLALSISKNIKLIPSVGVYGAYHFSAGDCDVRTIITDNYSNGKFGVVKWNPIKDEFYSLAYKAQNGVYYIGGIDGCREWTYGGIAGLKMQLMNHLIVSANFFEDIMHIQSPYLQMYGLSLSVGYRF